MDCVPFCEKQRRQISNLVSQFSLLSSLAHSCRMHCEWRLALFGLQLCSSLSLSFSAAVVLAAMFGQQLSNGGRLCAPHRRLLGRPNMNTKRQVEWAIGQNAASPNRESEFQWLCCSWAIHVRFRVCVCVYTSTMYMRGNYHRELLEEEHLLLLREGAKNRCLQTGEFGGKTHGRLRGRLERRLHWALWRCYHGTGPIQLGTGNSARSCGVEFVALEGARSKLDDAKRAAPKDRPREPTAELI